MMCGHMLRMHMQAGIHTPRKATIHPRRHRGMYGIPSLIHSFEAQACKHRIEALTNAPTHANRICTLPASLPPNIITTLYDCSKVECSYDSNTPCRNMVQLSNFSEISTRSFEQISKKISLVMADAKMNYQSFPLPDREWEVNQIHLALLLLVWYVIAKLEL